MTTAEMHDGPLWIMPGQPDNVLTVFLGYGRRLAGRVGNSTDNNLVGFDAYRIRTSDAPWYSNRIQVRKTTEQWVLATTQQHFLLEDPNFRKDERDILRTQTLEEFLKGEKKHGEPSSASDALRREPLRSEELWIRLCMGNGNRSEQLRRLQRLHNRVSKREQHSDSR